MVAAIPHASEVFIGENYEQRLKQVKAWLVQKGVRDFEPVSLFCDQLPKVYNFYCSIQSRDPGLTSCCRKPC